MQTNKPVSLFVDKHPKIIKISYTIHPYMPLIIRCKKKKKDTKSYGIQDWERANSVLL